jgi:hypothetical protein
MSAERPAFATSGAVWMRQVSRAISLVIVVALMALLFGAAKSVLSEGERLALDMAEQNLEDLVWLEGRRALAEEGVRGLQRRAGSDPRTWALDRLTRLPAGDALADPLPQWADDRWQFDAARGELVYAATWIEGGDRRWRVALQVDGAGTPTPGMARDLLLLRVDGRASPP